MIITSFNILADTFVENNIFFLDRWYPTLEYDELMMKNRFNTLIKYIKGDVIMLQEVTPHIRKKIYDIFKLKYIIMPLFCHKSKKENNMLLVFLVEVLKHFREVLFLLNLVLLVPYNKKML